MIDFISLFDLKCIASICNFSIYGVLVVYGKLLLYVIYYLNFLHDSNRSFIVCSTSL